MPTSAPLAYEHEDHDSATPRWVITFVLLSILAHGLLILTLLFLSIHMPLPNPALTQQTPPTASLTLIQPPPQSKQIFMPTPEQPNAKHKDAKVESDHDTRLASQSKTSRDPNTIMPDVVSKDNKSSSLESAQSAPPTKAKDATTTPPTPKSQQQAKPTQTPPQPQQPQQAKTEAPKTPPQQAPKPPPKPSEAQPKTPPPPTVDDNGLPVLPTINAPTMAPQTPANASQQAQVAATPVSMPIAPRNLQGLAGISGQPSPEAMKTDLGQYKALFYRAVGSRWYAALTPDKLQLIGIGSVRVQYTIYPDGTITTKVLDDGGSSMVILLGISQGAIQAVSPFRPFPPSMLKQYPNGYTDDFTFSIYGQ